MLRLVPVTQAEYDIWAVASKKGYKAENIKNGLTDEEAQKKTDDDFQKLLPEGLLTPDHYIFSIKEGDLIVGNLWFAARGAIDNRKAYIFDIVIDELVRGKGYGKQTMDLLEVEVKKLGLRHIGLHVFGHNHVARALYEKQGYEITNLVLEKVLS